MYAIVVLVALVGASAADEGQKKYTTKFDNLDLDSIIRNERILKNYFYCLMDKGPCTSDGKRLKKDMPEALENDCEKCSVKQRVGAEKALKYLYEKKHDMFKELEAKYDPDNKYWTKYKKRIEAAGVKP